MRTRPAHVVLLLLVVAAVAAATAMIAAGLRGSIEDSPRLNYTALAASLIVLAFALVVFVAQDARRAARGRRPRR